MSLETAVTQYSKQNNSHSFNVDEIPFVIEYNYSAGLLWLVPNAEATVKGGDIVRGLDYTLRKYPSNRFIVNPEKTKYNLPPTKKNTEEFLHSVQNKLYRLIDNTIGLTGKKLRAKGKKINGSLRDQLVTQLVYGLKLTTNVPLDSVSYHSYHQSSWKLPFEQYINDTILVENPTLFIPTITSLAFATAKKHYLFGVEEDYQLQNKVIMNAAKYFLEFVKTNPTFKIEKDVSDILIDDLAVQQVTIAMNFIKNTDFTSNKLIIARHSMIYQAESIALQKRVTDELQLITKAGCHNVVYLLERMGTAKTALDK